jgi:hypothetical protein
MRRLVRAWFGVTAGFVLACSVLGVGLLRPTWITRTLRLSLEAWSYVAVILGIGAVVAAMLSYVAAERERHNLRLLEAAKLSTEMMTRFYADTSLDDLRRKIRTGEDYDLPDVGITNEEVRLMNLFEVIGLAAEEGIMLLATIDKMVGTVLAEIVLHDTTSRLLEPGYSYEAVRDCLVPGLLPFWKQRLRENIYDEICRRLPDLRIAIPTGR